MQQVEIIKQFSKEDQILSKALEKGDNILIIDHISVPMMAHLSSQSSDRKIIFFNDLFKEPKSVEDSITEQVDSILDSLGEIGLSEKTRNDVRPLFHQVCKKAGTLTEVENRIYDILEGRTPLPKRIDTAAEKLQAIMKGWDYEIALQKLSSVMDKTEAWLDYSMQDKCTIAYFPAAFIPYEAFTEKHIDKYVNICKKKNISATIILGISALSFTGDNIVEKWVNCNTCTFALSLRDESELLKLREGTWLKIIRQNHF